MCSFAICMLVPARRPIVLRGCKRHGRLLDRKVSAIGGRRLERREAKEKPHGHQFTWVRVFSMIPPSISNYPNMGISNTLT